jgi:hypothetical protein
MHDVTSMRDVMHSFAWQSREGMSCEFIINPMLGTFPGETL